MVDLGPVGPNKIIPIYDPAEVTEFGNPEPRFINGELLGYVEVDSKGHSVNTYNRDDIMPYDPRINVEDKVKHYKSKRERYTIKRELKQKPADPSLEQVFKVCTPDWDFESICKPDCNWYNLTCNCGFTKTVLTSKDKAWNAFMVHRYGDAWITERDRLDQLWAESFPAQPRRTPLSVARSTVEPLASALGNGLSNSWEFFKAVLPIALPIALLLGWIVVMIYFIVTAFRS